MFLGFMCAGNEAFYILLYIRAFCAGAMKCTTPKSPLLMEIKNLRSTTFTSCDGTNATTSPFCSQKEDEKEHQVPRSFAMPLVADMKLDKNGFLTKAPAEVPVDQIVENYLASLPKRTKE
ncbi:hypothetical protein L5515_017274 [Caenorhabditis briggsae]|uniref:Uncharacterized protein n=1 Tax=Caenorhabditis briggsae TaxID=6238 RepID=A0AAE9F856_CAEBR|nr:hypothetical protein L5515_017274 [Caenorhabditis briggsae]